MLVNSGSGIVTSSITKLDGGCASATNATRLKSVDSSAFIIGVSLAETDQLGGMTGLSLVLDAMKLEDFHDSNPDRLEIDSRNVLAINLEQRKSPRTVKFDCSMGLNLR